MNQEDLKSEYLRLTRNDQIQVKQELMDIYLNFLFEVMMNHSSEAGESRSDNEARLINQMMFTKVAHLKEMLNGVSFKAKDGKELNQIIDPTVIATHVRNLYETVGMFVLIYKHTNTADEKLILYNLWVHAGFKFRQRFESVADTGENLAKLAEEQEHLISLKAEIEATELYKSLNESNQNKIQTKLQEKDFKIKFVENRVTFLSWQELSTEMGDARNLLHNIYTYFSLYAHPSNVAVFQFADFFNKEDEHFLSITSFNITNCFFLLSIFIAEYIKIYPKVLEIFEKQPPINQIIINHYNTMSRGHDNSINDSLEALG